MKRACLLIIAAGLISVVAPQATAQHDAFESLRKDVKNLYQSLENKRGIAPEDKPLVEQLRTRAAELSRSMPNDHRPLAIELQLSTWLKDTARVDELYQRILRIVPDNTALRLGWADRLKAQNRYPEVIEVIQAGSFDDATKGKAMLTLSDALFAEHRFEKSLAALNSIPEQAESYIRLQADQLKRVREEYAQHWEKERELRQQDESAGDLPRVLLATARGAIILELFENQAPNTVANFISLVDQGFYNGTKFHRADPNVLIQGGDPNTKQGVTGIAGQGNPGYYIADEHAREGARLHFGGSLAMFTTGPNTGGSQFYITVAPTPWLNNQRTVFGRVIEGLEVARQIQRDDVIEASTVIRRRNHPYVPETLPLTGAVTPVTPAPAVPPASDPTAAPQPLAEEPAPQPPQPQADDAETPGSPESPE